MDRLYCSVREILADLQEVAGFTDDEEMVRHIRAASQWIDSNIGCFYPTLAARTLRGDDTARLFFGAPLLSLTSITDDGTALTATDYILQPENRQWAGGPYTSILLDLVNGSLGYFAKDNPVVLTGLWGLWNETRATGALLNGLINSSTTALVATNGAKLSPGQLLKIDDEQLLVLAGGAWTDSTKKIDTDPGVADEFWKLDSTAPFNVGEIIRCEFEQGRIEDIASPYLSLRRGWKRTAKVAHASATKVEVLRTFTVLRGANGSTAAGHADQAPILEYRPPEDVNMLCRQIAALMYKKGASGWSGRQGDAGSGETFYISEFPKSAIERVRNHYLLPAAP